jgi:peptide/nickel transport system permease protein
MLIAVIAVSASAIVGTLAGLVAGFFWGAPDRVIGGVSNVIFAFPALLLAMSLASVLDRSRWTVALAIAVVYVPIFMRVVRGPVLSLREIEFVRAATSTGQSRTRVMLQHILPNVMPIVIVQVTLSLSWAVLTEAALSYLGLGAPPPAPSLGVMIFDARSLMYRAPWTMIFPGVVVVLVVVSLNLLGDGLRDTLDPRERGRTAGANA